MTRPFVPSPPELVAEVRAMSERVLTREELDAYVSAPMSDEERAEVLDLARWFTTRYPTVAARFAYNRRAVARSRRRAAG